MPDEYDIKLLVRTCIIWCIALRKHLENQKIDDFKISEIPAAKLMRFISKAWNSLCKYDPESFFPMPVILDSGAKFGRRVRCPYSHPDKPICDIDIINKYLGEQGINQGIRFHYERHKDSLSRSLKVEPLLSDIDAEVLEKQGKITKKAHKYLNDMCDITAKFTNNEMIAIGRHEDPEKLREDIIQEAKWLAEENQKFIKGISKINFSDHDKTTGPKSQIRRLAYDIHIYGSEMKKKAYSEKVFYELSISKIIKMKGKYPDLVERIVDEQKSPDEIWENERVSGLVFISFICDTYSKIVWKIVENHLLPCFNKERKMSSPMPELENAYDELEVLLSVDPDWIPIKFDLANFNKLKSEQKPPLLKFSRLNEMLCNHEKLDFFLQEISRIFTYIESNYLAPKCFVTPKDRQCTYQLDLFTQRVYPNTGS